MEIMEATKDDYLISTSVDMLDRKLIYNFLSTESAWSNGISFETVHKSIENSMNFGVYFGSQQIGFGRVITDFSTIARIRDVFEL